MNKCTPIKDFLGDYAFDVEYAPGYKFTLYFNSRKNAETVKRCIEVDDSIPNAATPVDFVEVVRCKNCAHSIITGDRIMCRLNATYKYGEWLGLTAVNPAHYCISTCLKMRRFCSYHTLYITLSVNYNLT